MKKIIIIFLLLILSLPAFIGLSYIINIEDTAIVKKYVTEAVNNKFPFTVRLKGETDFRISDGYHVRIKRLEITKLSDIIERLIFDDFSISKKKYDDNNYVFSFGKVTLIKSDTAPETTLANDDALINAIYAAVSPLQALINKEIVITIKSDKTIIGTPTQNGLVEFVLTKTNIFIDKELRIDTGLAMINNHVSLNLSFIPDEGNDFRIKVDAKGKIIQNNNVLDIDSVVNINRANLNFDLNLNLTTTDSAGKSISYNVEVKRPNTILSMTHDFRYMDLTLLGESIFEYTDNTSTFIFLADRYNHLMSNGEKGTETKYSDFEVIRADFTVDSDKFSASFYTEHFDTDDATSLINFIFDSSKNRRVNTDLLDGIGEKHILHIEDIKYNQIPVGNLQLIINGTARHDFFSLVSNNFYDGNLEVTAGFDTRLSSESNYFDITGEFAKLNLYNIVTSINGQSKYLSSGTLYGFIGIETTGVELWEMKNAMSGEIILETDNLNISSELTKIFTTTLQQTISEMDEDEAEGIEKAQSRLENDNSVDIQCARSLLFIDNGLITSDHETIFVTEHTNIYLSGSYNLNTEILDIGIVPNTKAFFDISASSLVKYFRVTGPLDDLSMSLDSVELLKSGASMLLSYTTGPLGSMAFDMLVDSADTEIDCNRMLRR